MPGGSAHERILDVMGEDVQYGREGPPDSRFEIYDDGEYMVVNQHGTYEVYELAPGIGRHNGQPARVLETEDVAEVVDEVGAD